MQRICKDEHSKAARKPGTANDVEVVKQVVVQRCGHGVEWSDVWLVGMW